MTTIVYVDGKVYTDDLAVIRTNENNYFVEETNTPKIFPIQATLVENRKRKKVTIGAICMAGHNPDFNSHLLRLAITIFCLTDEAKSKMTHEYPAGEAEQSLFKGRQVFILTHNSVWYYDGELKSFVNQGSGIPVILGTGAELAALFLKSSKGKDQKEREQMMAYINKYDYMTSPNTYVIDTKNIFDISQYDMAVDANGELTLRKKK